MEAPKAGFFGGFGGFKKKVYIYILVEETLRSTVNCIIVEVFLLKIVLHYVPFENQPDDPLKKLSIFFI